MFVLVVMNWREVPRDRLRSLETSLISAGLCFGGYVTGTPMALLSMAYYFKRIIPALQRYPLGGHASGWSIGLFGQWPVFEQAVGTFAYALRVACFLSFALQLVLWSLGNTKL